MWVGDLVEDVRDEEEISWVREGGEGAVRGDYGWSLRAVRINGDVMNRISEIGEWDYLVFRYLVVDRLRLGKVYYFSGDIYRLLEA